MRRKLFLTSVIVACTMVILLSLIVGCSSPTPPAQTSAPPQTSSQPPTSSPAVTPTTPSSPPATVKATVLHFATFDPPTGFTAEAHKTWAAELEKRTQGRYKVEISWAAAMGKTEEHYNLVRTGIADIAYFLPRYSAGLFPLSDITDFPWIMPDFNTSVQSFWQLYQKGYLSKEFTNVKPLFAWTGTGTALFSREPIATLADLKGKKVRSGGEAVDRLLKPMGAVPVAISLGEAYTSLQKGVVDASWTPWVAVAPFKLSEVARYCIEPVFGNAACVVAMNKETYDKLPKDVQAIIEQLTQDVLIPLTIKGYEKEDANGKKAFADAGGKVSKWSSADLGQMDSLFAPVWQKWITDTEAKGVAAKDTLDGFYTILKGLGVDRPAVGYAPK